MLACEMSAEAEDIKKRWQEYTEELYKNGLNELNSYNDVITHLEESILECEVKQALGSITMSKDSGGDKISDKKILKNFTVKVLHSICQEI